MNETNEIFSRMVKAQAKKYGLEVKIKDGNYEFVEQDLDCENFIINEVKNFFKDKKSTLD